MQGDVVGTGGIEPPTSCVSSDSTIVPPLYTAVQDILGCSRLSSTYSHLCGRCVLGRSRLIFPFLDAHVYQMLANVRQGAGRSGVQPAGLFGRERHAPGDLAVEIPRQTDIPVPDTLLDLLRVRPSFYVHRDESRQPRRLYNLHPAPALDIIKANLRRLFRQVDGRQDAAVVVGAEVVVQIALQIPVPERMSALGSSIPVSRRHARQPG